MSMLGAAIMLAQRGYAPHWLRARSKAPIAEGWSTAPVATVTDLRQTYKPGYNVGVRCGHWSHPLPHHGLVIIDVDIRSPEAIEPALAAIETLLGDTPAAPVVLSGSGNGSRHLWFACPMDALPPKANITIVKADGWQLEVLSTGKQVVVPPSIHPNGQPYRWMTPLTTLPLLPVTMHAAVEDVLSTAMQTAITAGRIVQGPSTGTRARPGDDFNLRADWVSILQPHGWVPVRQRGEVTCWRRPGKREGISATTNYAGTGLLYIFSTNAGPFESDTAYTPFAAYAVLDHGGNFTAAARMLGGQGYGGPQGAMAWCAPGGAEDHAMTDMPSSTITDTTHMFTWSDGTSLEVRDPTRDQMRRLW